MEEHKRSKKRRAVILFLLAICMMLTSIRPSATAYAADEQKKVKVGYFENEIFQEGAGEGQVRKGYAYEYYQKIAEYTGWEYEYVYGSFSDLYRKLLSGDIDLLAGLAYTSEREGIIGYPRNSMGRETYNLVKHAFDDSINNLPATLSGKRIGVQESAIVATLNEFMESGAEVPNEKNLASHFEGPEEVVEKAELKEMLKASLDLLTDKEKQVVLLYYYEELTLKEISYVLEVTESRVSQIHTNALQKMREKLGRYMGILTG